MHFCKKAVDCFCYYDFDPRNKVAEVIAYGEIRENEDKCCTDKLEIIREIPWQELLEIVNTGIGCTGLCNSGNYNSGDYNSGYYNSGRNNSGCYNSGNFNSGFCNIGCSNSGDYNSGDYNSGNYNSGSQNIGDWNNCDFSNGCFNTESPKIYLFNKPSEWIYRDWLNSEARRLLNQIPGEVLRYVSFEDMTDEEKEAHPESKNTGGYLKTLDNLGCAVNWWRNLTDNEKEIIMSIPNFDKKIFKEITGIDVDND